MILIADSGSTKTSWLLISGSEILQEISTSGYNPYYYKDNGLIELIEIELLPQLKSNKIEKIHFYGSGCSSDINCTMVKSALWQLFPNSAVEINHDLTGAAVALLKNKEGIACILGTGSNSCYWDGKKVTGNVPSVGYLLGDEGSGTYIGMKILKGILEGKAPHLITNSFYNNYKLNFEKVLTNIYGSSEPNRFFASISKFANEHLDNSWVTNTVKQAFNDFIENQIKMYPNYQDYEICFTGSIAYYFKDVLLEACKENGLKTGLIIKNPIEGLYTFHSQQI